MRKITLNASGLRLQASRRSGQALVELMVGLVVVMVLVSGLLQIASMCRAHTDVMVEARKDAAMLCMLDLGPGMVIASNPDYIRDWHEGGDDRRLSRDDESDTGDASAFHRQIIGSSVHNESAWSLVDAAPYNELSRLRNDPFVATSFGLVKGTAKDSASLSTLPAFRRLVYDSDTIDVEATTWMTLCKGVY
jgi:hypothetical protein